ncbi:hypothetical protein BDF21DRAFT_333273 [Thamnidium elegans]|nr:hypothetical protein BDF21DRAFT_333273 [Thamnidium elegans]
MPRLQPSEIHHRNFDFIIIGEAGTVTQHDMIDVQIPLLNSKLKNTDQDWQLKSVPQPNVDRSIAVPLGKLLGGSSAFNACIYHRCSPSDYDAWNAEGWSYRDLQPYFRKAETFHDEQVDSTVHGTQGPLHATHINKSTQLGSCFKRACQNYGLKEYRDMTDMPCQIGVTGLDASIYQGRRSSAGSSYLSREFEAQQSNLFIGLGCKVTRLIMQDNTVVAVEYTNDGETYTVHTNREVILSAGAILSPFILLSSGIGPASDLKAVGEDVKVDLPGVGKNLQNHWRLPLVHETMRPDMSLHDGLFKRTKESLDQAINTRDGAFTELWPDAVAYMKVPNAPDNSSSIENTPQIELFVGGLALCRDLPNLKHLDCATLLMVYLTPFSKGTVKLTAERTPSIDLGLLSDDRDLECMEKGLQLSMQIADDTAYTKCIKRWMMRPERDLKEYIKANVDTLHHYAGTCKMGPKEDPLAVVDNHLRVHGVNRLRVVDASFFPIVPAGQICYPVIACAERASDIILADNE